MRADCRRSPQSDEKIRFYFLNAFSQGVGEYFEFRMRTEQFLLHHKNRRSGRAFDRTPLGCIIQARSARISKLARSCDEANVRCSAGISPPQALEAFTRRAVLMELLPPWPGSIGAACVRRSLALPVRSGGITDIDLDSRAPFASAFSFIAFNWREDRLASADSNRPPDLSSA